MVSIITISSATSFAKKYRGTSTTMGGGGAWMSSLAVVICWQCIIILLCSASPPLNAFCFETPPSSLSFQRLSMALSSSKQQSWHAAASTSVVDVEKEPSSSVHTVNGVTCIEVKSTFPVGGGGGGGNEITITILEATASSQEVLVNLALEDEQIEKVCSSLSLTHADPYGAVLWPAASAVARTLLADPAQWLHQQTIVELGAGTGLVSLAAAAGGAAKVIATDYEAIPLQLLEYAQTHLNRQHPTSRMAVVETQLLDLCQYKNQQDDDDDDDDAKYVPLPPADLVVAADVMYEPKTGRALAHRVVEALARGSRVLIGDSPGRAGRPAFLQQLYQLGVPRTAQFVDVPGWTVTGDRNDLICGSTSTSHSKAPQPQQIMVALMELDPKVHGPQSWR